MKQGLLGGVGVLMVALLAWNTARLGSLDARLAALEAAEASSRDGQQPRGGAATAAADGGGGASGDGTTGAGPGSQGHPPRTDRMFRRGSSPPGTAPGPDDVDPEAVLGLDDPVARKALDRYLDAYMQARQEDASYDDESQFIEHASAAIEMYGEDANLSDEVQERILQRLETANTNWFEIDRSSAAGELDSREVLERRQKIEESVTRDMIELLGEESWEELAGRIW